MRRFLRPPCATRAQRLVAMIVASSIWIACVYETWGVKSFSHYDCWGNPINGRNTRELMCVIVYNRAADRGVASILGHLGHGNLYLHQPSRVRRVGSGLNAFSGSSVVPKYPETSTGCT